jgi:hypothetical protein
MHNPWVDRAYQGSRFLSQAFIAKLDHMLESGEPMPADPVLLAQDLPQAFNTQPCPEPDCALVNLQFGEATIRQLKVEMEAGTDPPRIASISHVDSLDSPQPAQQVSGVDRWVPLVDEVYGFSLRYPSDWRPVGLKANDMHTSQDYPVMRTLRFEQPGQTGTIAPFILDVLVGDREMVAGMYPGLEGAEQAQVNGYAALRFLDDMGHTHYIFRHPVKEDTWLAAVHFGDEEQAGIFEAMVSTIAFSQ